MVIIALKKDEMGSDIINFRLSSFYVLLGFSNLSSFLFMSIVLLSSLFNSTNVHSQIALPTITVTPSNIDICDSCVNLTATIEGILGTTSSYSVSEIPYTPFSYDTGTPVLVHIDDQWSLPINIPFCFQFYNHVYNQFIVGSNQLISFDLGMSNYCPYNLISYNGIPNPGLPRNSIMGPYQDIDPSISGNTYIQIVGSSPYRKFIISFYETPYFVCNGITSTSQIVLYETTNIIDVYIKNKPICTSWNQGLAIEGIQNATGTIATPVPGRNNTAWSTTNNAHRFTPNGPPQYTLTWYDSNNNIIGNTPTISVCPTITSSYTAILITNTCGIPLTDSSNSTVNVIGIQSINITSTPTSCISNTGTATAYATSTDSSYTYIWNSGGQTTQTATGLSEGTYSVTVSSSNGCNKTASVIIDNVNTLDLTLTSIPINCVTNKGEASVFVSDGVPGYTYLWSNGSTTATTEVSMAGSISVLVTDSAGCTKSGFATISLPIYPTAISASNSPICVGDSILLNSENTASMGLVTTYLWSGSNLFTSVLQSPIIASCTLDFAGSYKVIITENGCSDTSMVNVIINPIPITDFTVDTVKGCEPLEVEFKNNSIPANGLLLWDFGDGNISTINPVHTYTNSGFYNVTLTTTSNNCSNSLTKNKYINVLARANADFNVNSTTTTNSVTTTIFDPSFIFINTSTDASIYFWNLGEGSFASSTDASHTYAAEQNNFDVILYANNQNNCPDSTKTTIYITEPLLYYIPNTFTPDGNNFNELFQPIFTSGYDPKDFHMLIFNRWGEIIFETNDVNIGWNGTYKDNIVDDGIYAWEIDFKMKFSAEKKIITGHINLIR